MWQAAAPRYVMWPAESGGAERAAVCAACGWAPGEATCVGRRDTQATRERAYFSNLFAHAQKEFSHPHTHLSWRPAPATVPPDATRFILHFYNIFLWPRDL